jgi:hypothetical protein
MHITIKGRKFSKALLDELSKYGKVDKNGMTRMRSDGKLVAAFVLQYKDEETLVAHTLKSFQTGAGAIAMRIFIRIADVLGLNLFLEVCPFEIKSSNVPRLSSEQLVALYIRQGFRVVSHNKGKVQMLRKPVIV